MMSWIDSTGHRCGPLAKAAAAFAASQGLEPDPPRGVDALVALASAIEGRRNKEAAHADEDEDDRRFIELAGAFFATTLADTLNDGHHVERGPSHRLRLGRFGCFDPFAGIARALLADNAKRCLLEQISEAEAHARDQAPVCLVAAEVLRQLQARALRVEVRECFGTELCLHVEDEPLALELSALVSLCEDEGPQPIAAAVERLLGRLPFASLLPGTRWPQLRPRIFPRLLSQRFLDELPTQHGLVTRRLGGGAALAYIVRFSARARYLKHGDLPQDATASASEALSAALENLADCSGQAAMVRSETEHGPLVTSHTNDGLDSSRLLLPGLHDVLATELGSPFLAAVPHRDALMACPREPSAARAMATRAHTDAARARYPITARLFEVHPGGRLLPASD